MENDHHSLDSFESLSLSPGVARTAWLYPLDEAFYLRAAAQEYCLPDDAIQTMLIDNSEHAADAARIIADVRQHERRTSETGRNRVNAQDLTQEDIFAKRATHCAVVITARPEILNTLLLRANALKAAAAELATQQAKANESGEQPKN